MSTGPTIECWASCHPHWVCFWQFVQKHAHQLPAGSYLHFVGLWQCSSWLKRADTGTLLGWWPSRALSSSPSVTAGFLVSPLCSWMIRLQLPPHAFSSDKDTSRTQTREEWVRKDKEQLSVANTYKTILLLGVVLHFPLQCTCCYFYLH